MKHTLFLLPTLALAFAALAQPSPTLPPTRLAPGSGVTITTNGVNNFTISASGGSSVTNLGNGSNTLLATNLSVVASAGNALTVNTNALRVDTNSVYVSGTLWVTNTLQSPGTLRAYIIAPSGANPSVYFTSPAQAQAGVELGASGDLAVMRSAAGLTEFNNGTAGIYRDLRLRTLEMYAQPSDPSSSATLGMIYAKTNAGTTEVFVMDGAGNVTQISPHARAASPAPPELDTDAQPIVIHHANLFLGTEEFLHLSALAKEVEKISGKKFLFQRQLDPARKRDWATEETAIEQRHATERAADLERLSAWQSNTNQNKGPQPPVRPAYVKRPKPAWLP